MSISKKKLYDRYLARLKPLLSSTPVASDMAAAFHNGKTEVLRMSRFESSAFDTSWIDVIEDVLFDLGEIINAPRTITKEEGSLVPVELAKKTNAESVQHLASHTQYVKNIDEQGNVVPSKIMSFANDDFLYTYENRFIATFIRRLVLFVEKRYAFIQAYIPLHKEEVLMVKTKALINDEEVEIETRIKTKTPSLDPAAAKAESIASRIRAMREYILYYYASPFMHKMKNERDVRKPILMTNILRKNLRYHKCYEVFNFIEKYDSLGMNYKSEDRYGALDDEQLSELSLLQLGQYLAVMDDSEYESIRVKQHNYKPKMRSSIDEEEFLFAPLPKGPIEFVRVDEEFQKYLDRRIYPNLPLHPKRGEAQFYADEYADKRTSKEDQRQIQRLLSRKEAAAKRFEKVVQKLIDERIAEEALLHKMEEEERLYAEELLLEKKRAEIRGFASMEGKDVSDAFEAKEDTQASVNEEPHEAEAEDKEEPIAEPNLEEELSPIAKPETQEEVQAKEEAEPEPMVTAASQSAEALAEAVAPKDEPAIEESLPGTEADEPVLMTEPQEQRLEESPIAEPEADSLSRVEEAVEPEEVMVAEPKSEVKPQVEEVVGPKEEPAYEKKAKKAAKKAIKAAPIKAKAPKKPVKEKKARKSGPKKEKKVTQKPEAIPGTFVVKCPEGYYVAEGKFSKEKSEAKIFLDFNEAIAQKKRHGGKVVKI